MSNLLCFSDELTDFCDSFNRTVAKRSPVLGYNHNFKHRGLVFHVQTEDSGVNNPHLFTHLFHGGVIISSRRMDYDPDSEVDTVKSLMQSQHKAVLKDLKIGTFDDKIDEYLGDKEGLLPRKGNASGKAGTQAVVHAQAKGKELRADTEVDDGSTGSLGLEAEEAVAEAAKIQDKIEREAAAQREINEAAAEKEIQAAVLAAEYAKELNEEAARMHAERVRPISEPVESFDLSLIEGAGPRARKRLPTAVEDLREEDKNLGDPMVTFSSGDSDDGKAVPRVIVPASSGAYSMRRQDSPAAGAVSSSKRKKRGTLQRTPTRARTVVNHAAGGKSVRPRSSVVVSRPSVVVGGSSSKPGHKNIRQARESRPENKSQQISEKSLHEVIMAYLSDEESKD